VFRCNHFQLLYLPAFFFLDNLIQFGICFFEDCHQYNSFVLAKVLMQNRAYLTSCQRSSRISGSRHCATKTGTAESANAVPIGERNGPGSRSSPENDPMSGTAPRTPRLMCRASRLPR